MNGMARCHDRSSSSQRLRSSKQTAPKRAARHRVIGLDGSPPGHDVKPRDDDPHQEKKT
jgi:hypothetical protein